MNNVVDARKITVVTECAECPVSAEESALTGARTSRSSRSAVHGKQLVYLDNARHHPETRGRDRAPKQTTTVTTTPTSTAACMRCRRRRPTRIEDARVKVQHFLNARHADEIIFTRGTTEAINLVAQSYARPRLQPGDEIILSRDGASCQHRAVADGVRDRTGAVIKVVPINDEGELVFEEYLKLLGPRTKLVGVVHVSNALGTINPVKRDHPRWPTPTACRCWSTVPRRLRTRRSTCRSWTATSTRSPATSSTARRASACCTASRRCSKRCRLSRAAAT